MSKFDYMNFSDGCNEIEFVVHANKFTREEAVELFINENNFKTQHNLER